MGNQHCPWSDVVTHPKIHSKHFDRMVSANMTYPMIVWKELVIDGNHRLGHAYLNKYETIDVIIFDDDIMDRMCLGQFNDYKEYRQIVHSYGLTELDQLFVEKFC